MHSHNKSVVHMEHERKYLIRMPSKSFFSDNVVLTSSIEQTYLSKPYSMYEERVRAEYAHPAEHPIYTLTTKTTWSSTSRKEENRTLSYSEYMFFYTSDTREETLLKIRHLFPTRRHLFEIDIYPFWERYAILEVELSFPEQKVHLPNCLHVIAEVTADKRFSNRRLAIKHITEEELDNEYRNL